MDTFQTFSTLPLFFAPLPTASLMSRWDHEAQELGLAGTVLMENAARSAFQAILARFPTLTDLDVGLVIGSGNNGGDAAAIGRYLHEAGIGVTAYLIKDISAYQGECARQLALLTKLGLTFAPISELIAGKKHCDLLIDGLLGTGFHGPLRSDLCELIQKINALHISHRLAVDIPSGLDADTGLPEPEAIAATLTICMSACKKGLALPCAKPFTGHIQTVPIGLPAMLRKQWPTDSFLIDEQFGRLACALPANSYKNRFGHVAVLGGGDTSHTGAAHLAARAALRAGAGLVTAIARAPQAEAIRLGLAEIMLCPLEHSQDGWPKALPDSLQELLPKLSSLVIGPGFGLGSDAANFFAQLLAQRLRPPMVIDADALTLLARRSDLFAQVRSCDILTPHPGEAAALLGLSSQAVQKDRYAALAKLIDKTQAVVVMKGAGTLVGQRHAPVLVSPWDLPSLAIGGAGDVLAGLLGTYLAQRDMQKARLCSLFTSEQQGAFVRKLYGVQSPQLSQHGTALAIPDAAFDLMICARAVSRHALAANELAAQFPQRGFLAHELADSLATLPC